MNKQQRHLEQMISLTLIAYNLGLWYGEALRDVIYAKVKPNQLGRSLAEKLTTRGHPKWSFYSGLFVLLKQKLRILKSEITLVIKEATDAFAYLINGNVRTFVRT